MDDQLNMAKHHFINSIGKINSPGSSLKQIAQEQIGYLKERRDHGRIDEARYQDLAASYEQANRD